MKYKAAAIQFEWKPGDSEANLLKAEKLLEQAGKEGVELAVLQEYFLTAYGKKEYAQQVPGPTTDKLGTLAKRFGMYIAAGTMVEKDRNSYFSTLPLIGPDGKLLHKYRKVHIYPVQGVWDEAEFTRGEDIPVIKTSDIGNIGLLAAVDIDVPITAWLAALKGCEVLVCPHLCSSEWVDAHRYLLCAAAWQNMIYVVAPNPVGYLRGTPVGDMCFLGGSRIISPMGEILANAGEFRDGMAIATIDTKKLYEFREWMKDWKGQRVPKAYEPYIKLNI